MILKSCRFRFQIQEVSEAAVKGCDAVLRDLKLARKMLANCMRSNVQLGVCFPDVRFDTILLLTLLDYIKYNTFNGLLLFVSLKKEKRCSRGLKYLLDNELFKRGIPHKGSLLRFFV